MRIPILLCSVTLLLNACSKEPEAPVAESPTGNLTSPTEKPTEAPQVMAKASIASVTLSDDCPDEIAAAAREIAPLSKRAPAAKGSAGDSLSGYQGEVICQQSMMQIAFDGQGTSAAKVEIKAVRILSESGESLAILKARLPSIWTDNRYIAWNSEVPASSPVKTQYKLSAPNWSEVEQKNASVDSMLVLEVQLEVGGVAQTVTSKFRRVKTPPAMMIQT